MSVILLTELLDFIITIYCTVYDITIWFYMIYISVVKFIVIAYTFYYIFMLCTVFISNSLIVFYICFNQTINSLYLVFYTVIAINRYIALINDTGGLNKPAQS